MYTVLAAREPRNLAIVPSDARRLVVSAAGEPVNTHGLPDGVTLLCRGAVDESGHAMAAAELGDYLRPGKELERLGVPNAAILIEKDLAVIAADHAGFRHVYGTQRQGWAAVSTSARELARQIGAKPDLEALAVQRIVGHHLNEDTAYAGVRKLPASHLWRLENGELTSEGYPPIGFVDFVGGKATRSLVRAHAARIRELVCGFLDSHENVVLELSGGMDSRLILAAVPAERRKELTGFTLVHNESADAVVARQLAQRYGMRHVEADISQVSTFEPEFAYQLAHAAAMRQDGLGAPLSAAVFEFAERPVESQPRLSGHGGELARVSLYQLQPNRPKPTPRLAQRFFDMFFAKNQGVPDATLDPEFAKESREIGYRRLRETFTAYEGVDWLTATDLFFLRERLHRWAGATITPGCDRRVTLNPLLDWDVLAIMMSLPHPRRWSSQQAVDALWQLDPELAKMPLASGMRPVALRRPGAVTRLIGEMSVPKFAGFAARKVLRRGARRDPVGAPVMASLVAAHWRANPSLLAPAAASNLLSEQWLSRLLDGAVEPDVPSIDFILNLNVILTAG